MTIISESYIAVDDRGKARVAGTRSSVANIVMDTMNGLSPMDIHDTYPHLSLSQIHAALAYYYDHKSEIDSQIEQGKAIYEQAVRDGKVRSQEELQRLLKAKLEAQEKSE
jgi:uncharacterized protein (DUF433 family)